MKYTHIVLHENPDLDAILSSWLLVRFGEDKYPGIANAGLLFCPAHSLPDGQTADELEQRGILAVDTGYGRMDQHSNNPSLSVSEDTKYCSSMLVAQDLEIQADPALQKILQFTQLHDLEGRNIESTNPIDHLFSLITVIRGLNLKYPDSPEKMVPLIWETFDALYEVEQDWVKALRDFENATQVVLDSGVKIVAIESDSSAATKVARLHKADIVIHKNSQGHIGVTIRKNGRLKKNSNLVPCAQLIRAVEAIKCNQSYEVKSLENIGTVHGWYLHDTLNILSRGSPKKSDVPPSKITLEEIMELIAFRLAGVALPPKQYCPQDRCTGEKCSLYRLALPQCFHLRKNLREKKITEIEKGEEG